MQTFRISDALRCTLVNAPRGPNLVWPRGWFLDGGDLSPATLWKETLVQRHDRVTQVQWEGMRLGALASARVRAGRRVWEVDRLYLPSEGLPTGGGQSDLQPDDIPIRLLEHLIQAVGAQQAERVFLRLPSESQVVPLAQRAGLLPCFEETLLERPARRIRDDRAATKATVSRERVAQDKYPLFQLFSAATPQHVRAALGLTFDQWWDAQETQLGRQEERLTEQNGRLTGWLSIWSRHGVEAGEVMAHPEHPESLSALANLALARPNPMRWLVPDYQEMTKNLLMYHGFEEKAKYVVLIKTVAIREMTPDMAAVEA